MARIRQPNHCTDLDLDPLSRRYFLGLYDVGDHDCRDDLIRCTRADEYSKRAARTPSWHGHGRDDVRF